MKKTLTASILALCISGCPKAENKSAETVETDAVEDAICVDEGWHRQDNADSCGVCPECCVDSACTDVRSE